MWKIWFLYKANIIGDITESSYIKLNIARINTSLYSIKTDTNLDNTWTIDNIGLEKIADKINNIVKKK